jgi:hypothetical protein
MSVHIGDRFGRLLVVANGTEGPKRIVTVLCDCGQKREVQAGNLTVGHTTSCGCYRVEQVKKATTTHGHRAGEDTTPEYEAWRSTIARCYDSACESFPHYGGKGGGVCQEWQSSFAAFLEDVGPRPSEDHVISRRRRDEDFTRENTFWATRAEAARNKSTTRMYEVNGVTKCLEDWATEYGIGKSTLHYRLKKGLSMREALDLGHGRSGRPLHA